MKVLKGVIGIGLVLLLCLGLVGEAGAENGWGWNAKRAFLGSDQTVTGTWTFSGKVNDTKEMSWAPVQVDAYVTVKDGIYGFVVPDDTNSGGNWDGLELKDVTVGVGTKGVTGAMDIQIRRVRGGSAADMLSTKVTVGDEYYAADGVVNASNDDIQAGDLIFIDCDAIHTTAAKGLFVTLLFR